MRCLLVVPIALVVGCAHPQQHSYGNEKPVCDEHDEACWSQNRRADLNVAQMSKH